MEIKFNSEIIREFVKTIGDPNPIHLKENPVLPLDFITFFSFLYYRQFRITPQRPFKVLKNNIYSLKMKRDEIIIKDLKKDGVVYGLIRKEADSRVIKDIINKGLYKEISISKEYECNIKNFFYKHGVYLNEKNFNELVLVPYLTQLIVEVMKKEKPKLVLYTNHSKFDLGENKDKNEDKTLFYYVKEDERKRKKGKFVLMKNNIAVYKEIIFK